jgi:hypothetical protein
MAFQNAELGIESSRQVPENDERNSNLRAIFYNGLVACGYMRLAQGTLDGFRERAHYYREEQKRLDADGSDERELREEEWGGALLLSELETHSSNGGSREGTDATAGPHLSVSTRRAESVKPLEAIASFTAAEVVEPLDGNKEAI